MNDSLSPYFQDGPYRFSMQFGRTSFRDFYGSGRGDLLRERRRWLSENRARYLAVLPEAAPLLDETIQLGSSAATLPACRDAEPGERALFLGQQWEPDYLLLSRREGNVRLVGACVCFPSSWSLEEKIGRPIDQIHEVVPGLNHAVGRQIEAFLHKLRPGVVWTRSNWGLSRSPELNQHPARNLPPLDAQVEADEVYFRVEEQALSALPENNGVLFGIRLKIFPFRSFFGHPAAAKLRYALETMPEEMARYKGLGTARARLIDLLAANGLPQSQ